MDKLSKLLQKLSPDERSRLEAVLQLLISGNTSSLDIKKLKGSKDIYRARAGNLRVIFQKSDSIRILEVSRRSDTTYRNY